MTRGDLVASLWMVAFMLLIVGALVWLLPQEAALPTPDQTCVQVASSDGRGMPTCHVHTVGG